jgi:NAD(P)-dependent dehydrogenase (short-subunit alcohol dehydrogenase family)
MTEKGIFDLSGKVALVTGGGSGLGRVFCQALAEFGADVACADISREWAEETVALISPSQRKSRR